METEVFHVFENNDGQSSSRIQIILIVGETGTESVGPENRVI